MSFTDVANERLLASAAGRLGALQWGVEPDPYQRLTVSSGAPVAAVLRLMARRSLEPSVVGPLLDAFPARPLERALIAWDIARGSLLGRHDGDLTQRLSQELAPLKRLGEPRTVAIPRDRISALVEEVRPLSEHKALFDDFQTLPSLAALVQLTEVRKNLDDNPEMIEAIIAHAKQLALAHLPSLALAFLQVLWDRFKTAAALDLMIEVALDHGMLDALPWMPGQDDRSMQQQAYLLVRESLRNFDTVSATRFLEALSKHPAISGSNDPSLALVQAELAVLKRQRLDDPSMKLVESIATAGPGWRYAVAVHNATEIQQAPDRAVMLVESFVSMFGNNARMWAHAADHVENKDELLALLSREVRYTSHDPEVWRAVAILVDDGIPIDTEVDQRLNSQLVAALS